MNKVRSYKKLIISGIFLLLLISNLSIIGFSIEPSIDKGDGIYYIDKFYDGINVNLENCKISEDNNEITLDPYVSSIDIYGSKVISLLSSEILQFWKWVWSKYWLWRFKRKKW